MPRRLKGVSLMNSLSTVKVFVLRTVFFDPNYLSCLALQDGSGIADVGVRNVKLLAAPEPLIQEG
jgi:hypothetical protein